MKSSLFSLAAVGVAAGAAVVPAAELTAGPYAPWAHAHTVWMYNKDANQTSLPAYLKAYKDHNISVGAVNVDSEWATGFNTFQPDESKWPDMQGFISDMHAQDVHVIAWATSFVNTDDPDYEYASNNNFLIRDRKNETGVVHWWHGDAGLIDYTNPEAVDWWHGLMQNMLDMGLDGWKCDGSDPYVLLMGAHEDGEYGGYGYDGQVVTYRDYATAYYSDFYAFSKETNPEALIMSRPCDNGGEGMLPVYVCSSPHDVEFFGWVGDQDGDWAGLKDAMTKITVSAWHNYLNFGADIGGYRTSDDGGDLGRTGDLLLRWAEIMAFMPVMENGGAGAHTPWSFELAGYPATFVTDTYRDYVNIHEELREYLYATGTERFAANRSAITPLLAEQFTLPVLEDFSYTLGDDIFVHPITDDTLSANVTTPAGDDEWVSWWDASVVLAGGETAELDAPLHQLPVFKRAGALLPMRKPCGALVFEAVAPVAGRAEQARVYEFKQVGGVVADYVLSPEEEGGAIAAAVSATGERVAFAFQGLGCSSARSAAAVVSGESAHLVRAECDEAEDKLWLHVADATEGARFSVRP